MNLHRAKVQVCLVFVILIPRLCLAGEVVSNLTDADQVGFGIQTPANAAAGSFTRQRAADRTGSIRSS